MIKSLENYITFHASNSIFGKKIKEIKTRESIYEQQSMEISHFITKAANPTQQYIESTFSSIFASKKYF